MRRYLLDTGACGQRSSSSGCRRSQQPRAGTTGDGERRTLLGHCSLASVFVVGACWALQDRQLTQIQTYDIITHRPVVQEPAPAPRRTKQADRRLQYNIVSNLDHSIHHYAPPEERPKVEFPPARRLLKSAAPATEIRSYDVLTNKCVHASWVVL